MQNKKQYPFGCFSDEYACYFSLYGKLIYTVPHYYKKYEKKEDGGEKALFPKGSSCETWPCKKYEN